MRAHEPVVLYPGGDVKAAVLEVLLRGMLHANSGPSDTFFGATMVDSEELRTVHNKAFLNLFYHLFLNDIIRSSLSVHFVLSLSNSFFLGGGDIELLYYHQSSIMIMIISSRESWCYVHTSTQ